ncbi:hypothetical protein, partial [Motilibacter deserti]
MRRPQPRTALAVLTTTPILAALVAVPSAVPASATALPEVPNRTIGYDEISAYPRENVLPVWPVNT